MAILSFQLDQLRKEVLPKGYGQDKSLHRWVPKQRELLTDKAIQLVERNCWTHSSSFGKPKPLQPGALLPRMMHEWSRHVIGSFNALVGSFFLTFPLFMLLAWCRIWESVHVASTSSVGLPNEAPEETEPAPGQVGNRFERPSANKKRARTCLVADSEQRMVAGTTQPGNAAGSCSCSKENDDGRDEQYPEPALVTSSTLIRSSDPEQEIV
jgi:hypothetical protein